MNIKLALAISTVLILLTAHRIALTAESAADPLAEVGKFKIIRGEKNGLNINPEDLSELTVMFSNDMIYTMKNGRTETASTYTLKPSIRIPGALELDMTSVSPQQGERGHGLVEISLQKGLARLIFTERRNPLPRRFSTQGIKATMFILEPLPK
ncbi:hypothetical protein [Calycomorphotria hydatis]|uniref:Uncharacterized protein n=1 Tax=Calycomorphotria hydatis TaxID=2528027 RepID=A0A517TEW8_9PLAN|nr:hypothetical protein [Calycomorphotria hydatis]QDT66916.1 hypothetical protein V22_41880 [Calycomorphotria hydatis]